MREQPLVSLLVKTGVIEYNHVMQRSGHRGEPSESMTDRIRDLGLRREDIIEKFIRSAGKGGQNVNKTSTCVYLKHLPTGIEVKCQQERSQAMNRVAALGLLAKKIARGRPPGEAGAETGAGKGPPAEASATVPAQGKDPRDQEEDRREEAAAGEEVRGVATRYIPETRIGITKEVQYKVTNVRSGHWILVLIRYLDLVIRGVLRVSVSGCSVGRFCGSS